MTTRIHQCDHATLARTVGRVDVLVSDPPFSPRVHDGQACRRADGSIGMATDGIGVDYDAWTDAHIHDFVATWSPRVARWMVILCSHDLIPVYEHAFRDAGRYVHAPVPCIIRGMSVRLRGDGPSSWAVYAVVARPRGMLPLSGTLQGAYVGSRERLLMRGAKPRWLMHAILNDYTRDIDVVCDPCASSGTTMITARELGRISIGAEPNAERYAIMRGRLDAVTSPRVTRGVAR